MKITNESNLDQIELILSGSTFEQNLEFLDLEKALVTNFYPKYIGDISESILLVNIIILTIKTEKRISNCITRYLQRKL